MRRSIAKWTAGAAVAASTIGMTAMSGVTTSFAAAHSNLVELQETGSSLLYPLFSGEWIPRYNDVAPNVEITAASTGSGAGIAQAIAGTVQIGASDAYMSDGQMQQSPTIENIPLAISAQQVMYNVPGLGKNVHLHFTGSVLAQIFMGKISYWDDAAITRMNKGVTLPHQQIIPVHRSDGSGDTFLFSQFLSFTNSDWNNGPAYGTSVSWPAVQTGLGAKGNDGVVAVLSKNPYTLSYVGISWLDRGVKSGLGYAALQNKAGKFLLPTQATILAAANAQVKKTPADERMSLIYGPGKNSYPIINFEYAIINTQQKSGAYADALKNFLNWAISPKGGDALKLMKQVHFLPLPKNVLPLSAAQIAKIHG